MKQKQIKQFSIEVCNSSSPPFIDQIDINDITIDFQSYLNQNIPFVKITLS